MRVADRNKMGTLRTLWAKTKTSNWVNKPYTRGTTAWKVQQGVTKAAPVLKGLGYASAGLSGALAGWDQYKKDSANPSMGEGEKIARAGTQAVTQGVGGYAGGWAGGPGWYDDWRRWWPYWHCRRRDYRRGDRRHGRFETRRVSGQCHQQGLA